MSVFALLAVYLTAAFSLAGGVITALFFIAGPVGSSTPPPAKLATTDGTSSQIIVEPLPQAFRYGPEINHGASDTPVNARQQALREARAMAPAVKIKHHRVYREREPMTYPKRMARDPGPALGFTPSVPSSGH